MLDIKVLENSWFFKKIILEPQELVFDEWDVDNNIYILLVWELLVEKYIHKKENDTKVLAVLKQFDVFWEASLNNRNPKEVRISAKRKSILLAIDAKDWIDEFAKKYPVESLNLLKYIIFLTNKRLLDSNKLITATYKISKEIIWIDKITNKKIFELIDKLKDIIDLSYIIYYEKNPVIDNYLKLMYDTREKWKLQDEIIEMTDNKLNLLNLKIDANYFTYIQKLSTWDHVLWYLIFYRKDNNFNENDKKILISTSTLITWIIKQKQVNNEEKNKEYLQ